LKTLAYVENPYYLCRSKNKNNNFMKTVDLCNAIGNIQFPGMVIDRFVISEDKHKVGCFNIRYTDPIDGRCIGFAGEVNGRTVDFKLYGVYDCERDNAINHCERLLLYVNDQIGRYDYYKTGNVEFLNY